MANRSTTSIHATTNVGGTFPQTGDALTLTIADNANVIVTDSFCRWPMR
ncbi:MAG TPA: hypothetical protein VG328_22550 [Stellaceae bacterium]|nr:hypothetical protein [Stellaceae bacterium]